MAPINHVGYLRRRDGSGDYQLNFAVLWNGELSLFPCDDSSNLFPNLNTTDTTAEVVCLTGAVAFMPFRPSQTSPGDFTLLGRRGTWKAYFQAPSKEDALIWLARISECRCGTSASVRARCFSSVLPTRGVESVDDSPGMIPSTALTNWIRRAKEASCTPSLCTSPSPTGTRQEVATEKLACLNEQLKERVYLLKQLEAQESQFVCCEQAEFRPCRFVSAAKTSFCLLPGNKSTEVQTGDKIVVLGLQPDFTWRCEVHRQVHAVVSSGTDGQPGCTISFGEQATSSRRRSSVGPVSETDRLHSNMNTINEEGLEEQSKSHKANDGDDADEDDADDNDTKSVRSVPDFAAARRGSTLSLLAPDLTAATRSPPSSPGPSQEFSVSVSAVEMSFPLVGALPSLQVLSFVPEEANQVLAEAQLLKIEVENRRASLQQQLQQSPKSGRALRTVARRIKTNASFRVSSASAIVGPRIRKPALSTSSSRAALSSGSTISMSIISGDGILQEQQKFAIRSQSAEPKLDTFTIPQSAPASPQLCTGSRPVGTFSDSSDDEDDPPLRAFRSSSRASVRKLFKRTAVSHSPSLAMRSAHSAGNVASEPDLLEQSIAENRESVSTYKLAMDDLPSHSSVGRLRASRSCGILPQATDEFCTQSLHQTDISNGSGDVELEKGSLLGWENDSRSSGDTYWGDTKVKLVQFDWPTRGLHLSSFSLVLPKDKGANVSLDGQESLQQQQQQQQQQLRKSLVTITHVDEVCSAYKTDLAVGDVVISINEHKLEGYDAEKVSFFLLCLSLALARLCEHALIYMLSLATT